MLILPALQSNSTGSVLINDGTLGAGIRELKACAAATMILNLYSSIVRGVVVWKRRSYTVPSNLT